MCNLEDIILKHLNKKEKYSLRKYNCGLSIFYMLKEAGFLTEKDVNPFLFKLSTLNKDETIISFFDNIAKFKRISLDEVEDLAIFLTKLDSEYTNHIILYCKKFGYISIEQKTNVLKVEQKINEKTISCIYKIV